MMSQCAYFAVDSQNFVASDSPSLSHLQNLAHEPNQGRTRTSGMGHSQGKAAVWAQLPYVRGVWGESKRQERDRTTYPVRQFYLGMETVTDAHTV